jgi:tRNA A-37 threonylcarbamoyl transferase component Bud32
MSDSMARLAAALADRYRIERELGAGGMATVYLAEDLRHRRKVAIKVLRPELTAALGPERFLREIETTANLRHPHILPLYDSGEVDGFLFYMMPLVEGESLRERITRERQLPIEDALAIAREVADALGYAHSRGIIHRDIKPENILLEGGHAVVADFGIARAVSAAGADQLTRTGMSIGTPSYMSPEQAAGEQNLDGRSDLYALGCVLYEMLGGQPPFSGPTVESVVHQHLMVEAPPITNLRPTVPVAVAGALARTLAKNPADRFNPAAQFVQALSPAIIATTTPGAASAPRPAPRSRMVRIGAGVAALVAVAAAGYVFTRGAKPAALLEPKRVVVATFENKSGDPGLDPLGAMAADWIARGLVGTGLVDVGGTAADLAARAVTSSAQAGQSAIQALARNANAGLVISGAYYAQGDSVLFQADFTDANAGKLVQTVGPVAARASAPLEGVERLRQRVIGSLGPLVDARLLTLGSVLSRPPSLEAYREFLAGQDLFYSDEAAAVGHFARATAADSTYQVPLLWSLVLLHNMGDGRRADSLIRLLEGRRERMTPYERVYLDYAECRSSPGIATCVPSTAALLQLTPKSQFVKYLHAIMLRWANRPRAADSEFRELDPLSGELRGRIYFVIHHAGSLHALGEYERELAVVREGQVQYPGRQYLAFTNVRPLVALGRLDEVDRAIDEAFGFQPELRSSAARTGALTMYELRWHGHANAAEALGNRLLAKLDARPAAEARTERGRHDRAVVLMAAHHWSALQALADSMATGDPGNVEVLRLRGVALAMQGRRAAAEAIEQALERDTRPIRPADGCPWWAVCRRSARAYIAAALGDKARAVTLIDGWVFRDGTEAHFDLLGELLRDYVPFQELAKPGG